MKTIDEESWSERTNRQVIGILGIVNAIIFAAIVVVGTVASLMSALLMSEDESVPEAMQWVVAAVGILGTVVLAAFICGATSILLTLVKDFSRSARALEVASQGMITLAGVQERASAAASDSAVSAEKSRRAFEAIAKAQMATAKARTAAGKSR